MCFSCSSFPYPGALQLSWTRTPSASAITNGRVSALQAEGPRFSPWPFPGRGENIHPEIVQKLVPDNTKLDSPMAGLCTKVAFYVLTAGRHKLRKGSLIVYRLWGSPLFISLQLCPVTECKVEVSHPGTDQTQPCLASASQAFRPCCGTPAPNFLFTEEQTYGHA